MLGAEQEENTPVNFDSGKFWSCVAQPVAYQSRRAKKKGRSRGGGETSDRKESERELKECLDKEITPHGNDRKENGIIPKKIGSSLNKKHVRRTS